MSDKIDDLAWFAARPDRRYRLRLATPDEIADVAGQDHQRTEAAIERGFLYAVVKINRETGVLLSIVVGWPPLEDLDDVDEDALHSAWWSGFWELEEGAP